MAESKCIICEISSDTLPSKKIYEDDQIIAILDYNGVNPGHSFVFPKEHIPILEQVPPFLLGRLFNVANKISSAIFDALKVHGTNIMVSNGVSAGQKVAHFMIQVIPRMENDGVSLQWAPKQLSEEEMSTVELKLKEEISRIGIGKDSPSQQHAAVRKPRQIIEQQEGEDNYLVKQLNRIP